MLKVSDNYSASIVGNFSATATIITVDVPPVKTEGYLTVFDLEGNQLEKIKYTGVDLLDLTGCVRGLSFDENTDEPVDGFAKELKNGMSVKMAISQQYYNAIIDVLNGDAPVGGLMKNPAARTITDNRDIIDKEYADQLAIDGSPKATENVFGIAKLSSAATNPLAPVVLNSEEVSATSAADKVIRANGDGKIDESFIDLETTDPGLAFTDNKLDIKIKEDGGILKDTDGVSVDTGLTENKIVSVDSNDKIPQSLLDLNYFGSGADGDAVISTNTNLARDMYYNNLTVNNGVILNPSGYRIFVRGTLTNNGTISRVGNNGTNGGQGNNPGTGGSALSAGSIYGGLAGGNGGNGGSNGGGSGGSNGSALNPSITNVAGSAGGGGGGNGGVSGAGGTAGSATAETASFKNNSLSISAATLTLNTENTQKYLPIQTVYGSASLFTLSTSAGSGGGGGGAASGGGVGGAGGGAGGNGGLVYISARILINNGTISVRGGNGGNGGNGGGTNEAGGGGGGAGGAGGLAILIYTSLTAGTINVDGGSFGTGGTGQTYQAGANGTVGNAGKYIKILIN